MKVLYFHYLPNALGPALRTFELARALGSQPNCEVHLVFIHPKFCAPEWMLFLFQNHGSPGLTIHFPSQKHPIQQSHNAKSIRSKNLSAKPNRLKQSLRLGLQALASLRFIRKESYWIRKLSPQILMARPDHVFSFVASAWRFNTPLLLESDGPIEELSMFGGVPIGWLKGIDTWRARQAKIVSSISTECIELWKQKRVQDSKLVLLPNGADPKSFAPNQQKRNAFRKQLGLEGKKVIGFSGNQRNWHGLPNLLNAFNKLLQTENNIALVLVGVEASYLDVERYSNVYALGRIAYEKMPEAIDACDIMVLPYDILNPFYFSPMKMFEAMSMAKPIVYTKQGQAAEILGGSIAGFAVDDPSCLQDGMQRALDALGKDPELGQANRNLVFAAHSWNHRGQVLHDACTKILQGS